MGRYSIVSLLLLAALFVSCGGKDTAGTESNGSEAVTGGDTTAIAEDSYQYPVLDCGG